MLDLEEINQAIAAAGPLNPDIQAVARLADDQWALHFEPGPVLLELDAEHRRLGLSAEIGPLPEAAKAALMEAMLCYNILWAETGGVQLALSGPSNTAVLLVLLASHEITPEIIANVCSNLAERMIQWRGLLAGSSAGIPETETHSYDHRSLV